MRVLHRIAERDRCTISQAIEAAVWRYDTHSFFRRAEEDLRRLEARPDEWADYLREQKELEGTLMDNQEPHDAQPEGATV
jgi:hypothetical protein